MLGNAGALPCKRSGMRNVFQLLMPLFKHIAAGVQCLPKSYSQSALFSDVVGKPF